jgi:hypothetical protein
MPPSSALWWGKQEKGTLDSFLVQLFTFKKKQKNSFKGDCDLSPKMHRNLLGRTKVI